MLRLVSLLGVMVLAAFGAEEGGAHAQPDVMYKWINFGILIVGIIVLLVKFAVPALKERATGIERDLVDSKSTVASAEAKVAELTRKLGNFDGEIADIRSKAKAEREVEGARIQQQTASMLSKVSENRENEVKSLAAAAQSQLRAFTVEKALEIAHQRLASQTDPSTQGALVTAFLNDLKRQEAR